MPDCKIQIIIPVYNAERTLKKCLDSLLKQTFSCWQAILVDDQSKDNSLKILNDYAARDDRFVVIAKEINSGSSATRNLALKILNAKYTAFLDSDDYWEPDMLEKMLSKAEKYHCDVVQCRFIYDFPGEKKLLPVGAFKKDVYLEGKQLRKVYRKMMTGINMNHVCMKLIRTELLAGLEFDTSLPTAEDLDFCIKIFKKARKYYFINDAMYHYCRWEDSLTGKGLPFSVKLKSNQTVSKTMLNALANWDIDTIYYRTLTRLRPYVIIISKAFRMLREKLMSDKGDQL